MLMNPSYSGEKAFGSFAIACGSD